MSGEPLIWILSGGRHGDLDQMLTLAKAIGWPFEVKQLSFRKPDIPLLAPRLLKQALAPPWPDLVLCAEASASVIALGLKHKSGGRTRAVCIGRPSGRGGDFDLIITTPQYRIPRAANVVELSMPLSAAPPPRHSGTPDGPIVLLVGGPAFPDRLDAPIATTLATELVTYARGRNKLLSIQTSPRTPVDAVRALKRAVSPPHSLSIFGTGENRYRELIADASEIVVTSDSISMLADALGSGRPVSVYPLPKPRSIKWQLGEWLYRNAVEEPSPLFTPVRLLFDWGLIEAAADRKRLHTRLITEQRLTWFGEPPLKPQPVPGNRDLEMALGSLRALMG
jgi:mitochondrial fission protein ELM1